MPKHALYRWQHILIEIFNVHVVLMVDISLQDDKFSGPVYADTAPHITLVVLLDLSARNCET